MQLLKLFAVSVYYVVYLIFDKWLNIYQLFMLVITMIIGAYLAQKGKSIGKGWKCSILGLLGVLYIGVVVWVAQCGGLTEGIYESVLFVVYIIGSLVVTLQVSNKKWNDLIIDKGKGSYGLCSDRTFGKINKALWGIFVGTLIPIVALSPYVFARADDYSFGYRAHIAWETTGSVWELLKAVFEMIKTAYYGWQGTYSSIFLMSLQPAVFDEKLYAIVPMLFILIITLASYFFVKTILVDWLKADKKMCGICISAYVLLVIQCMPVKQSAFFWYNGAIHYIGSHCVLLCLLAFAVKVYLGRHGLGSWIGAAICAVYVGGGNHVTAVSTLLIVLTMFLSVLVNKSWKKNYRICVLGGVYLVALCINIMAPGNFIKMGWSNGLGIVEAFFQAFIKAIQYVFNQWVQWETLIVIAVCSPIIWRMVAKMKISFSYPLVFVGYSWCYMASLFFTPLFTLGHINVGRFQNIMFLQAMLWLMFDIGYIMGWLQRKYKISEEVSLCKNEKKYVFIIGIVALGMSFLYMVLEPERYTSTAAINTLQDKSLYEYADDYWYNVEQLETEEKEVVIKDLSNIPIFLNPVECEAWYSGLRLFYEKDEIHFDISEE